MNPLFQTASFIRSQLSILFENQQNNIKLKATSPVQISSCYDCIRLVTIINKFYIFCILDAVEKPLVEKDSSDNLRKQIEEAQKQSGKFLIFYVYSSINYERVQSPQLNNFHCFH